MKNVVSMIIAALLGIIFTASMMTIAGRSNREQELIANLSSCVEETINTLLLEKQYEIADVQEFTSDFKEALAGTLDSDSDISVDIAALDTGKGLASVRVTEEYLHPNGKPGSVSCTRTVIFEQIIKQDREFITEEYLNENGVCYKKRKVLKSS